MDGHAVQVGGVVVDSGNFDWNNGKFPGLTEPDDSYHGVVYTKDFGRAAFIVKARTQLMRDIGFSPTAHAAFLTNLGLETLALRMERHCENALKVAEFLQDHPTVKRVSYPGLRNDPYYERAKKYLPKGASGVLSFCAKGGREAAAKFQDSLKLARIVVHVAMVRTCALYPAGSTHRQMTDDQLAAAGITPDLVRLSVGIENADDIIADLEQALDRV
jgi:O-acetylhomoserine (thiol)-lyase